MELSVVFLLLYVLSVWSFDASDPAVDGEKAFVTLDDEDNFVHNDNYKGFSMEHLEWMWYSKHLDVWEPVAWFLKACVWYNFELNARAWMHVQIFSHALGGALLYRLMLTVLGPKLAKDNRTQQALACLFGAGLWTLHPLRAEVVGWISCISYNFGVVFVLASLLCYYYYLTSQTVAVKVAAYVTSAALFFLALACKTPTISTLFGYLFIDAFVKPHRLLPVQRWVHPLGPVTDKLLFLGFAIFCVRMAAPGDDPCENERTPGLCLTVQDRFIRACWALGFYLRMTIWPSLHMPHYALEGGAGSLNFETAEYLMPSVLIPTATVLSVYVFLRELAKLTSSPSPSSPRSSKQNSKKGNANASDDTADTNSDEPVFSTSFVVSAAWVFYITWSLPAVGIVQHGVLTMGADRYHYLPAMVFGPVGALLFIQIPKATGMSRHVKLATSVCLIGLMIVLTRAASRPWTNTVSLYTNAQRFRATNTGFALNNFGYWFYREEIWPKAIDLFEQALMQEPDNIKGIINLADIHVYHEKDPAKAVRHYEKYVEHNPRSGSLINNMISIYHSLGRDKMTEYHHYLVPLAQVR